MGRPGDGPLFSFLEPDPRVFGMHSETQPRTLLMCCIAALVLSACASSSSGLVDSLKYAGSSWFGNDVAVTLIPGFRYLRVVSGKRVNYLVLGYADLMSSDAGREEVEVWYSARRETLRLLDGHLVGAVGLPAEWLDARFESRPKWAMVGSERTEFLRERDVMPGHRFRIRDKVAIVRTQAPAETDLQGVKASALAWFEETIATTTGDTLPPAYFGVRMDTSRPRVEYSYQCISAQLCFSAQQWPPPEIPDTR